jgi:aromatase
MSNTFTLGDLRNLMLAAVGADENTDLEREDVLDTPFTDLGYDSLAILEVASQIGLRYEIEVPDADVERLTTPRETIDYVNGRLAGTAAAPAAGVPAAEVPAAEAPVAAGEITGGKVTENVVEIDAPFDLVWDVTNNVPGWPELFSEYAKVEIIEQDGNRLKFRLHTRPDETGRAWDWVSERVTDRESRSVQAKRVSPGPFEYMKIFWSYEPLADDRVRMRWVQHFHLRPEAPVDDAFMAERINRNSATEMSRIKEIIEERVRAELMAGA